MFTFDLHPEYPSLVRIIPTMPVVVTSNPLHVDLLDQFHTLTSPRTRIHTQIRTHDRNNDQHLTTLLLTEPDNSSLQRSHIHPAFLDPAIAVFPTLAPLHHPMPHCAHLPMPKLAIVILITHPTLHVLLTQLIPVGTATHAVLVIHHPHLTSPQPSPTPA